MKQGRFTSLNYIPSYEYYSVEDVIIMMVFLTFQSFLDHCQAESESKSECNTNRHIENKVIGGAGFRSCSCAGAGCRSRGRMDCGRRGHGCAQRGEGS
jgi:hypothetical protein